MSPKKLTDRQLVLLSAAAQRENGGIELTGKPKRAVANRAVRRLLNDGLVEEVPAGGTLPVWRRDDDRGVFALRITARGPPALPDRGNQSGLISLVAAAFIFVSMLLLTGLHP
jgi:hypothetical protein